ncbi:MFS transporter [Actinokineospora pegani]|uniref:MFS transporter n=1 Tax=Actinokineospora pegani TaxID=2654637 RepID=UPI0012EA599D|nr:MFS transporter [Actinokineospora pegani]
MTTLGSRRGGSERALLVVLVLVVVVVSLVSSLGAPLVPLIAATHGVSLSAAQWTLTVALLAGAVATPVLGRLGDGRLRRPVILGTLVAVVVGCLLGAMPLGYVGLLVGRALQGVGFGLMPLAMTVARGHLSPDRVRGAVALLSVTTIAGVGVGYPISGALSLWGGVPASYWFGFGLGLAVLAAAYWVLPTAEVPRRGRLDVVGAVLVGVALTSVLLAVGEGLWVLGAVGAVVFGVFVVFELRAARPLVELRLLRRRRVLVADLTGLVAGVGVYLLMSAATRVLQEPGGLGASVLVASCAMVPFSVVSLLASRLSGLLRVDQAVLLPVGCLLFAAAMVLFWSQRDAVWLIFVVLGVAGAGAGCTFAAMPGLIVDSVPTTEVGSAIGVNQVVRTIGYSGGSALSAALLAQGGYDTVAAVGVAVMLTAAAFSAWAVLPRSAGPRPPRDELLVLDQ